MIPDYVDQIIYGFFGLILIVILCIVAKPFHNWFTRINEIVIILEDMKKTLEEMKNILKLQAK